MDGDGPPPAREARSAVRPGSTSPLPVTGGAAVSWGLPTAAHTTPTVKTTKAATVRIRTTGEIPPRSTSTGSSPGTRCLANPAPPVEFFARGVDIDVAWLGGSTIRSTGDSFATPHMAGLCALVLGKHAGLTPFQLKSVLYLTATNVGGGA